jgi:hypothetical protein
MGKKMVKEFGSRLPERAVPARAGFKPPSPNLRQAPVGRARLRWSKGSRLPERAVPGTGGVKVKRLM